MNKNVIFIIFFFQFCGLFFSCRSTIYVQKPTDIFGAILRDSAKKYNQVIQYDGVYHHIDETDIHVDKDYENGNPKNYADTPFIGKSIYFLESNLIGSQMAACSDSNEFISRLKIYESMERDVINDWGVYKIEKDTIKAIIYYAYTGGNILGKGYTQRLLTHFEGYLKNKDTIIGWHMVQPYPYPKIPFEPNSYEFNTFLKPRDLYFKKVPVDTIIDSKKVWINKYRKN